MPILCAAVATSSWSYWYQTTTQLVEGLGVALLIFAFTLLFSLPLGLGVALGKRRGGVPAAILNTYISVMRGTPLMLQLLVWYFGPYYLVRIPLSRLSIGNVDYRFTAVVIGFSLNYAAYFAEIFRAGIESIPRGQYEAQRDPHGSL